MEGLSSDQPDDDFKPRQNEISSLLQLPASGSIPRTSAFSTPQAAPTARNFPPIALTNIEQADDAEFAHYLSRVRSVYEQLQKLKEDGTAPAEKPSEGSLDDVKASRAVRQGRSSLPPLPAIPNVYFHEDFQLENPRIFDVVSERAEIGARDPKNEETSGADTIGPRKALASNAILHEKISSYMDTSESHLDASLSSAAATFFAALDTLKELHTEAEESFEQVQSIRTGLATLDEDMVARSLELLQKQRAHHNIQLLNDAVLQLAYIVNQVAHCEALIEAGHLNEALDDLDAVELLMAGKSDQDVGIDPTVCFQVQDLRGASALQGVTDDLLTLRTRIGNLLQAKLHTVLIDDIRRHLGSVSSQEVLDRWENTSLRTKRKQARETPKLPTYMGDSDDLRAALVPLIAGLHRSKSVSTSMAAYRGLVLRETKRTIRKLMPSSKDKTESAGNQSHTSQEKSVILLRNIRSLDDEDAEKFFSALYIEVTELLRRVQTHSSLLLDSASRIQTGHLPTTQTVHTTSASVIGPQEEISISLDMSNLLDEAVEAIQDMVGKVLRTRFEQCAKLTLSYALRHVKLGLLFVDECEAISGCDGASFRKILNKQALKFFRAHGERQNKLLKKEMASDQWEHQYISIRDSESLDKVLECATSTPTAWARLNRQRTSLQGQTSSDDSYTSPTPGSTSAAVKVGDEVFLLPRSAIICLRGLSELLPFVSIVPSMVLEITPVIASYMQLFDLQCRGLILNRGLFLGRGAFTETGMRNIGAPGVVLASQALSFITALVSPIREFIRRQSPEDLDTSGILKDLDKVKSGLESHCHAIYGKLVDTMISKASDLFAAALVVDWDRVNADIVSPYMLDLAKHTGTLYKPLVTYLPEQTVRHIMSQVFALYKEQLGVAFAGGEVSTEAGCDCMVRDTQHLIDNVGDHSGFGETGMYIMDIIQSRKLSIRASLDPGIRRDKSDQTI